MPADAETLVAALTDDVLDSFEKLEAVVRLGRGAAGVDELATDLGLERDVVTEAVDELIAAGAVERLGDRVAIAKAGPWGRHCEAVAALYGSDRMKVVTMMSQSALKRLRSKAARAFSDAFVVRSKKGDPDG